MKLEGGKISGSQLVFLMMGFIFGITVILIPTQSAGHMAWLAVLIGMLEALIFAFIFTTLAIRFPGKTLIQFNDIIYGPLLGKLISLGYLWYFLHLASLNVRTICNFLVNTGYPETPLIVFIILLTLLTASAVRNGIEVIARCSFILISITIFFYISDTILIIKDSTFTNLLPIGDIPLQEFIKASHAVATLPFGETVVFLMIIAFLNNIKEAKKSKIALIITGIFIAMASARNTAVLGITSTIFNYPSFEVIRLINIGEILTRLEIAVVFVFLAMSFLKISVLYYATVLGTAQLLKLRSYLPLVFPLGVIIVILSIINFENLIEELYFPVNIYPYYSLPFQVGIPLLSLIIAMIRGVPKKTGQG